MANNKKTAAPVFVFEITEAVGDLVLGADGSNKGTKYLNELMERAAETSPLFNMKGISRTLAFARWRDGQEGGVVSVHTLPKGLTGYGQPFTVRYDPEVNQCHLCVGFYNEKLADDENGVPLHLLPLGGVLSPDILIDLEDEIGKILKCKVRIPILLPPVWIPNPWGTKTIKVTFVDGKCNWNGIPVFLTKGSPKVKDGKEVACVVVCEVGEGIKVLSGKPNETIVRRPEFRTNERVPEGFDAVKVFGLELATATDDDVVQKANAFMATEPKEDDAICAELERLERKLDLSKVEDKALWRKAIFVGQKLVRTALREVAKQQAADKAKQAADSEKTEEEPAKPARQRRSRGKKAKGGEETTEAPAN